MVNNPKKLQHNVNKTKLKMDNNTKIIHLSEDIIDRQLEDFQL